MIVVQLVWGVAQALEFKKSLGDSSVQTSLETLVENAMEMMILCNSYFQGLNSNRFHVMQVET